MPYSALSYTPSALILHRVLRPTLHIACLLPLLALIWSAWVSELGVNPVETLTHKTGEWGFRYLLLSLLITPLIRLSGNAWMILFRRPLGLYAFFYAVCHFLVYLVFDQSLSLTYLLEDIIKRPYISVGFVAFLIMLPLTVTSTKKMRRRLGRYWQRLHKLSYVAAFLVGIHYIWLTRADFLEPSVYMGIFVALMAFRWLSSSHNKR